MSDLQHFQFYTPQLLWLLILTPFVFWYDHRKSKLIKLPLSSTRLVAKSSQKSWRLRLEFLPALIKSLAFICFVLALARPQFSNELTQIKSDGIDIMLTMDTSLSMQALDMRREHQQITRLDALKDVIAEFVSGRQADRIGLVVFGEVAYTQCPLTLDYDILKGFLGMIDSGIAGNGTAIGNGLAMAVKRLIPSTAKSKIIILLTDGRNEAGEVSPQAAADLAQKYGIKVYTIGVGSDQNLVPILLRSQNGMLYKDVRSVGAIDTALLKQIADQTGGQFFRAQTLEILQDVYKKIDTLEKSEVEMKRYQLFDEKFALVLIVGLVLYVLQWLLRHTVFFRVP